MLAPKLVQLALAFVLLALALVLRVLACSKTCYAILVAESLVDIGESKLGGVNRRRIDSYLLSWVERALMLELPRSSS